MGLCGPRHGLAPMQAPAAALAAAAATATDGSAHGSRHASTRRWRQARPHPASSGWSTSHCSSTCSGGSSGERASAPACSSGEAPSSAAADARRAARPSACASACRRSSARCSTSEKLRPARNQSQCYYQMAGAHCHPRIPCRTPPSTCPLLAAAAPLHHPACYPPFCRERDAYAAAASSSSAAALRATPLRPPALIALLTMHAQRLGAPRRPGRSRARGVVARKDGRDRQLQQRGVAGPGHTVAALRRAPDRGVPQQRVQVGHRRGRDARRRVQVNAREQDACASGGGGVRGAGPGVLAGPASKRRHACHLIRLHEKDDATPKCRTQWTGSMHRLTTERSRNVCFASRSLRARPGA